MCSSDLAVAHARAFVRLHLHDPAIERADDRGRLSFDLRERGEVAARLARLEGDRRQIPVALPLDFAKFQCQLLGAVAQALALD